MASLELNSKAQKLIKDLKTPWKLKLFFWQKLPSLLFWKVKVESFTPQSASVSIPFIKKTQNPFRSMYFAAQAGAAELSTGLLSILSIEGNGKVSMLVTGLRSEFFKKATTRVTFTCAQGNEVSKLVATAIETKEPQKITMISEGVDESGEVVSKFWIEWSFKAK